MRNRIKLATLGIVTATFGRTDRRIASRLPWRRMLAVLLVTANGLIAGASADPLPTAQVIEYYHPARDHYFVTADTNEAAALDAGVLRGWARTGASFGAYAASPAVAAANAVCRFYGLPEAGLDSHFYSGSRDECAAVARQFPDEWLEESANVFQVRLPDPATGDCASGYTPVYRLFNNRRDANHRYVTDRTARDGMVAQGYTPEGYGPLAVAFCAAGEAPAAAFNAGPRAKFAAARVSADTYRFDASASTDADDRISLVAWNFGDDTGATDAVASHTFGATGTFAVTLTVFDAKGATDRTVASVQAVSPTDPIPGPGLPASASFVRLASDPRGGDNGYNTFKRLPDGRGITFGGFSHDRTGNNAVAVYTPTTNTWQIRVPNTPWVEGPMLPDGSMDVRNRPYLGNRDNHLTHIVDGQLWVNSGERGIRITGNASGRLDLATWKWSIDDDGGKFGDLPGFPHWINSAAGTLPDGTVYTFGGAGNGNPWDGLHVIAPDRSVRQWWNIWGNEAFPGAEKLRYVSNSHFVRDGKVHVYGGTHEFRNQKQENGHTLYEIDVAAPRMRVVSVNPLPVAKRVEGPAILAYHVPAKDLLVTTDGSRVNVYDYASSTWYAIPVTTGPDPERTGYGAGFYAPEVDLGVVMYRHANVYGLRLGYQAAGSDGRGATGKSAPR